MKEAEWSFHVIAHIRNDYTSKFAVPRQSDVVPELLSKIVFEPSYCSRDALRGIDGWSHLWLIWIFHEADKKEWSPTVRPPRLGGNKRIGVFATRSPYRPNPIGLSCVRLVAVEDNALIVSGADLMDGTPILDIKPYLPYADCHPEAEAGFAGQLDERRLSVCFPPALLQQVPDESREALLSVLSHDPRPAYHHDPNRVYAFEFGSRRLRFSVAENVMTVLEVEDVNKSR